MTEQAHANAAPTASEPASEELAYRIDDAFVAEVEDALDAADKARVVAAVDRLHYADFADLVERLNSDRREKLIEFTKHDFDPEFLHELDETVRDDVIEQIGVENLAAAVTQLDSDDAVLVLEELDEREQQQVLDAIPEEDRAVLEAGLAYPDDSAGRMMQRELVRVPDEWTVGQTIDFMRQHADEEDGELPETFYDIFVVDRDDRPLGAIPLSRLLRTKRPVPVTELMSTEMELIPATMDQEEVAFLFSNRDLVSAPVVDGQGRLVGAITVDDVVDVIHEEHEEDLMRMGGVVEADLHATPAATARRRFQWLFVTLCNNVIAATVISQFEATIDQMVALAVLMPIVAGMGGNAGMQAVTVVVRALAAKELSGSNVMRVVAKEAAVGVMNGVAFAALMGTAAGFWFASVPLGLVLGGAMVFNMIWAGFAGTTIPVVLARMKIDPAIAAGPFLTTTTDVLGFFCFLGLATWFLL